MRGVRWYLVGSVLLVVLAGCGKSYFAQREAWRHEAEVQCLKSGAVKEGAGVVRVKQIDGPGICGADFPLKVAALGTSSAFGYTSEMRPQGAIPGGSPQSIPSQSFPAQRFPPSQSFPVNEPRFAPAARPVQSAPLPAFDAPMRNASAPPTMPQQASGPMSLRAPGVPDDDEDEEPTRYDDRRYAPNPPPMRQAPQSMPAEPVPLGRARPQLVTGTVAAAVKPEATLACPMVSALDQWIATAVQPAAMKWFGQPVVEIRQISAYSCRGMNGQPGARISEHAFGNALDIASFELAGGQKITVKNGWKGSPEEQGFLRDVQGAACEQFTTVLAPGSNRFHYDHIHVDLMRRSSGRSACNPKAVPGDVIAAKARGEQRYAGRRHDPGITGSIKRWLTPTKTARAQRDDDDDDDGHGHILPRATPGEDGFTDD